MSTTSIAAGLVRQNPNAEAVQQIREQVRRDVEQALQEARQARAEARAQAGVPAAEEGQLRVPEPPAPPRPPGVMIHVPQQFPGTGVPGQPFPSDIPQRAQEVMFGFFLTIAVIFIGTPLARAFARRIDRKAVVPAAAGPDVVGRLERIEHAVDAIALEVERISEGQRYVTKVMSEPRGLPSPNEADAHELRVAERAAAERASANRVR